MLRILIKRHPISFFILFSCLISWIFLYPSYQILLSQEGFHPWALIGLIGAYGPAITAILIQSVEDRAGLRPLLRSLIKFKVSTVTYLMAMLLPIILYLFAYFLALEITKSALQFDLIDGLKDIPIWFLLAIPFGPMGEELGWRGYLLPKLLERNSIVVSTILVGWVWGFWHLASFTFPGAAIPDFLPVNIWTILLFMMNTVLLSFL